jgi:hypothetical protein
MSGALSGVPVRPQTAFAEVRISEPPVMLPAPPVQDMRRSPAMRRWATSTCRVVDLSGLTGSTIRASQIAVRSGATSGSAGSVIGDIAVSGTLSPGASPGTMTVTANVSLLSGSVSLFEITPTLADKLVINGGLSIASGATLRIVADGAVGAGTSYDRIVASGGITGSYTTIDKAASLFGFVVQRADRIQLLGQSSATQRSARGSRAASTMPIRQIQVQPATSALFAALPSLLTPRGTSNPLAFAQLTPVSYASATQMGVDQTLSLTDVARGPGFATTDREDVGAFTFAQGIGPWHTLGADRDAGTAKARSSGYGFLGGIGIGNRDWSAPSPDISTAASGSQHWEPRRAPMASLPGFMGAMPQAACGSAHGCCMMAAMRGRHGRCQEQAPQPANPACTPGQATCRSAMR